MPTKKPVHWSRYPAAWAMALAKAMRVAGELVAMEPIPWSSDRARINHEQLHSMIAGIKLFGGPTAEIFEAATAGRLRFIRREVAGTPDGWMVWVRCVPPRKSLLDLIDESIVKS